MSLDVRVLAPLEGFYEIFLEEGLSETEAEKKAKERLENLPEPLSD